jgi:hypothetical protein
MTAYNLELLIWRSRFLILVVATGLGANASVSPSMHTAAKTRVRKLNERFISEIAVWKDKKYWGQQE